jgi:hypothetical protein
MKKLINTIQENFLKRKLHRQVRKQLYFREELEKANKRLAIVNKYIHLQQVAISKEISCLGVRAICNEDLAAQEKVTLLYRNYEDYERLKTLIS